MSRIAQIEAELDALGDSASAEDIAYALRRFDKRDIQAVLASRAGEGGGAALTVSDGVTTVSDVTTLDLTGHTVSELSPGVAEATVSVPVLTTTVSLNDAQIKALPTTPIELVPAPGVGSFIFVVGAFLRVDTSNDGYDNFDANASLLITFAGEGPGAAQGILPAGQAEDFLSAFTNYSVMLGPYSTAGARMTAPEETVSTIEVALIDVGDIENKALVLKADNAAAGNFTAGNAANSGSVTTLYMIVDL